MMNQTFSTCKREKEQGSWRRKGGREKENGWGGVKINACKTSLTLQLDDALISTQITVMYIHSCTGTDLYNIVLEDNKKILTPMCILM